MELISFSAIGRYLDVGVTRQGKSCTMLAKLTIKSRNTSAVESMIILTHQPGSADTVIQATFGLASRQRHRAILSTPSFLANALIIRLAVYTNSMLTRIVVQSTLVNVNSTIVTIESWGTDTSILGNIIDTFTPLTRIRQAFININFAIDAFVAIRTTAQVAGRILI